MDGSNYIHDDLEKALIAFLGRTLPKMAGSEWWRWCVVEQLGPEYDKALSPILEPDLSALDVVTLLDLVEKNWLEIATFSNLGDEVKSNIVGLKKQLLQFEDGKVRNEHIAELNASIRKVLLHLGADSQWIISPSKARDLVGNILTSTTYLGIDFGTATTVVSAVTLDANGHPQAEPVIIEQPQIMGGSIRDNLVNSVLAFKDGNLVFGREAYFLRQELHEGQNIFSSFKMHLGLDLGTAYPDTALRRDAGTIVIESPQDATREFFRLLVPAIESALTAAGMPDQRKVVMSVPAAFDANQRRDLSACMSKSGLPVEESSFIDEPNAAFLSHIYHEARSKESGELISRMKSKPWPIALIFDFGAGTCDVSVLEVSAEDQKFRSRNLAISRFTALGGDDIDREIARNILLPQLLADSDDFEPSEREIEKHLLPSLQLTAEKLKIAAVDWIADRRLSTLAEILSKSSETFWGKPIRPFRLHRDQSLRLQLEEPKMTLGDFARILDPFVGKYDPVRSPMHVFAPVDNAIAKSGFKKDDLYAVLFIGGSAKNPLVQTAIMQELPETARAIVPQDLRTHVSVGAAIHSVGYHGFGFDFIRPIVPEKIFLLTRDGGGEIIFREGAEVPSPDRYISSGLHVSYEGQPQVDLPIFVRDKSNLLGILHVYAPTAAGFAIDEEVLVTAAITHDKILEIEASVADESARVALMNPLANRNLNPVEIQLVEARQRFNMAVLDGRGRPSVEAVIAYAVAAYEAEAWDIAAEMYQAAERLDDSRKYAIRINYAYAKAGRRDLARKWAEIAYLRSPSALSAYNFSCSLDGEEKIQMLREALKHDSSYIIALIWLGLLLQKKGAEEGTKLLDRCVEQLEKKLENSTIDDKDCELLMKAADATGRQAIYARAKARLSSLDVDSDIRDDDPYNTNYLAAAGRVVGLVMGH